MTDAPVDEQEQLLKYARDLARAHIGERDKARQLEEALQKLEAAYQELASANAELARQRDALSVRVQAREHELKEAREQLGVVVGEDGAALFHGMVSGEPAMLRVFDTIRQVAETDVSVLIHGESGTGKELIARAVHAESPRRDKPFVALNCAAVTPTLAESLLFGHVRGAFTGAVSNHAGVFREAHAGTLFLDEVAELPLAIQAKLLRVVQEKTVTPVGATGSVEVDVRLVAASHRSLPDEVREGRFREDLMYRLRVVPIELPPLRERKSDLPRLLRHMLARLNAAGERRIDSLAPAAVRRLLDYPWPGNVRELENVLQYAFAVATGDMVKLEHLPADVREPRPPAPDAEPVTAARAPLVVDEAESIRAALAENEGRVHDAARMLGMSRATFHRKRKKYGLV